LVLDELDSIIIDRSKECKIGQKILILYQISILLVKQYVNGQKTCQADA
jgi:hypothetical protein